MAAPKGAALKVLGPPAIGVGGGQLAARVFATEIAPHLFDEVELLSHPGRMSFRAPLLGPLSSYACWHPPPETVAVVGGSAVHGARARAWVTWVATTVRSEGTRPFLALHWLESAALRRSSLVVPMSDFSARCLQEDGWQTTDPVPVPIRRSLREAELTGEAEHRSKCVLVIGRMKDRRKRARLLEETIERIHCLDDDVRFVVVSPDGWTSSTQRLGVQVLSRVSDETLARLISSSTCLLSTSRQEGFGMAVAEAMWFGTPVVATDNAAIRELLRNSPSSLLVGASARELSEGVLSLMESPHSDATASAWAHKMLIPRAAADR